jgi:hypothetical protein
MVGMDDGEPIYMSSEKLDRLLWTGKTDPDTGLVAVEDVAPGYGSLIESCVRRRLFARITLAAGVASLVAAVALAIL